jgi:hypothetical protein
MMRRGLLLTCLGAVFLMALPLLAQQTAEIAIGGGMVARIRDKGSFPSVQARAAHIDKQLCDVVSTKDTLHPLVTLKLNKAKLWTVYAWTTEIMSVYPAEAQASGLTDKQMGARWAANLKRQLPLATPCSKLPPEMLGYGKPGTKPGAKPAAAANTKPPKASGSAFTVNVAAAEPVAGGGSPAVMASGSGATESGALLLIVDAMRTARELDEQAWVTQKEQMARSLYGDLSYYVTGKGAPPVLPVTTAVKPTSSVVKPVKPVAKPVTKPATTTPLVAKPATASAPTTKPVVVKPATKKPPVATRPPAGKTPVKVATTKPATAGDPSMVRVPQKNRIRGKFAVAKPAYDKLVASDPSAAKPVGDLLADSRNAFARGDFDESERQADEALKILGVEYSGQ